jgi:hypothetical protein
MPSPSSTQSVARQRGPGRAGHPSAVTTGRADGSIEERQAALRVTLGGDGHVDDLPKLVDRAVDVASAFSDLYVCLIGTPAIPKQRSGRVGPPRPTAG